MNVEYARKLVDESQVEFYKIVTRIDAKIEEAAMKGIETLDVGTRLFDLGLMTTLPASSVVHELDDIKRKLVTDLIQHYTDKGFSASYCRHGAAYVPRAYAYDSDPILYCNWSLIIDWKQK